MPVAKLPELCLLVSTKPLLKKAILRFKARKLKEWEGHYDVYVFQHKNKRIALCSYYYGSSAAAVALEDLIEKGCRKFASVSFAVPVSRQMLPAGSIVLPSRAVRDEGTSFHYLQPSKEVLGNLQLSKRLKQVLKNFGLKPELGLTWTTDAPVKKVRKTKELKNSGALCLDWDSAALMSVTRYRKVMLSPTLLVIKKSWTARLRKDKLAGLKTQLLVKAADFLAGDANWVIAPKKTKKLTALKAKATKAKKVKVKKGKGKARVVKVVKVKQVDWIAKIKQVLREIDSVISGGFPKLSEKQVQKLQELKLKKEIFEKQFLQVEKELKGKILSEDEQLLLKEIYDLLVNILNQLKALVSHPEIPEELELEYDELIEDLFAQLEEPAQVPLTVSVEKPKAHKNRVAVYLVNFPRRYRYKPEFKRYFEEPFKTQVVEAEDFKPDSE